jgi:aminocarboxymuconate-semialdehyde decarboxylase
VGRLDRAHEKLPICSSVIKEKPSTYLQRIYYDSVVYAQAALALCVEVGTEDNVMYGSDYPHNLGDMTGCLARVDALAKGTAAKVRELNARRIFKL